jgi:hypothetical protein
MPHFAAPFPYNAHRRHVGHVARRVTARKRNAAGHLLDR